MKGILDLQTLAYQKVEINQIKPILYLLLYLVLNEPNQKNYSFCGTQNYMAPEILQSNGFNLHLIIFLDYGYDQKVDVWSLGCLFYEMITGVPAFSSKNDNHLYNKIINVYNS